MDNENKIAEMQKGKTFIELIKEQNIEIPIIQRDYAQGRLDYKATEIRDSFLTSIIDTLRSEERKTLVLDFVYGSTIDVGTFIPLDGQQRLTTLFLLHWYLASEDKMSILRVQKGNTIFSKFTYKTRISSKEFCNNIVNNSLKRLKELHKEQIAIFEEQIQELVEEFEKTKKAKHLRLITELKTKQKSWTLSSTIKDQSWFMWSWQKDPTVKAMLVMLDDLHDRIKRENLSDEEHNVMWNKLEEGWIVFHLLPPEKFNLTDELYVKMNARGKQLSEFDIFKSTLEEQMRLNEVDENIQNTWRTNIDSNWIDLFWNKIAKPQLVLDISEKEQKECVNSVENSYLRFLEQMMVFHLFINDNCIVCDWNDDKIKRSVPFGDFDENNILSKLREFSVRNDIMRLIPLFSKTCFFSQSFFEFVINSFESLIYIKENAKHEGSELIDNIHFEMNKSTVFESFFDRNIDYEIRVQFFAILQFYKYKHAKEVSRSEELISEFNSWMRIIRNLSTNSNTYYYNTYIDFRNSIVTIEKWASEIYNNNLADSILRYFVLNNPNEGFNEEQLKEESIKAKLILKSTDAQNWEGSIRKAEEHKYFLGQIGFLIDWSKEDDDYNHIKFNEYYHKICSVFNDTGLKPDLCQSETHIFRNALMANCEFYLFMYSFMNNSGKHRDFSWKRYLREHGKSKNIQNLLDGWDENHKSSFKVFCIIYIEQNKPTDWRRCFIEKPEIYNLLKQNRIGIWNWDNREIILLSKIRTSAKHWELQTYYWYLKFKQSGIDDYLDSKDETHPFSSIFHKDDNKEISVKYIRNNYIISMNFNPENPIFDFNEKSTRWEHFFESTNYREVESTMEHFLETNGFGQ